MLNKLTPTPTPTPQAGNAQFLRDEVAPRSSSDRHVALHFGQKPHAVIIACSDSRVPPVGVGVIRVYGSVGNVLPWLIGP